MELSKFLKAKPELPKSLGTYEVLTNEIDLSNYQEVDTLSYSLVTKKMIQLGKIQQCKTGYLPQVKSLEGGWRNLAKGQETIEQAKNVLFEKHCASVQKRYGWSDDELAARKTEVLNAIESLKLQGWTSIDEQLKAAIAKAEEKAKRKKEKEIKAKELLQAKIEASPIVQEIKAFVETQKKLVGIINKIDKGSKKIYLTVSDETFKSLLEGFKIVGCISWKKRKSFLNQNYCINEFQAFTIKEYIAQEKEIILFCKPI